MSLIPLVAMQTCEYLRAFLFGRTGWNIFNGPMILSGAITLFERQAVIDIGGYVMDSPGEDMEVIVGLHEYMRKMIFLIELALYFLQPHGHESLQYDFIMGATRPLAPGFNR